MVAQRRLALVAALEEGAHVIVPQSTPARATGIRPGCSAPRAEGGLAVAASAAHRCSSAKACPSALAPSPVVLRRATMSFGVSRDEEYVRLHLISDGRILDIGERGHNFLLLTLARQRLADAGQGWSEAERGWVYADELASLLAVDLQKLNIDVFHIRRHLACRGVIDARDVIERRRATRQIRLGVDRIAVATL